MCGIVAIRSEQPSHPRALVKALDAIEHRGPDGRGEWTSRDSTVHLGHNRLFVRGGANDRQPIISPDKKVAATVNGEFYGTSIGSGPDSEAVLKLYEKHGLDFVTKLRGEFAVVLYDEGNRRLVAVRDRFGIKPLVFSREGGNWIFASEAKAIFAAGWLRAEWDRDAVFHSLAHQYLPPEKTLFRGVESLPPAHLLILEADGRSNLRRYWQPEFAEERPDYEEIRETLRECVSERLDSRLPPAISLSGGLDSAAVAALSERQARGFSISFSDCPEFDEGNSAIETATALGIESTIVPVTASTILEDIEKAVYFSEGLSINGQLAAKYRLAKTMRETGYNVVLSGEGADEAFLGYAHLQCDAGQTPAHSTKRQAGVMLPDGDSLFPLPPTPKSWPDKWPTFLAAKLPFAARFKPLMSTEAQAEFLAEDRVETWFRDLDSTGAILRDIHPVKRNAWWWTRSALSSYILRTLGDGTESAHSVEGRLPFLDHRLFEIAIRIEVGANLVNTESKVALRQALQDILPDSLRHRPKHPLLAPPLLSELTSEASFDFMKERIGLDSFFDRDRCLAWLESRPQHADPILHTLLSLSALQRAFSL